ncbi:MAG: hypothetical protein N2Z22_05740 [Turneriella sp.]|nr:hypothetical protein [Turneriella sp.]
MLWRPHWIFLFSIALYAASGQYSDEELELDLGGEYQLSAVPREVPYPQLFPPPVRTVEFCAWQPQPEHEQQVLRPKSGFLCALYVLPPTPQLRKREELRVALAAAQNARPSKETLKEEKLGPHRVWRWRQRQGKSRFDYFLLFGKKYDYLFRSSPYGSEGKIEAIIATAKWR